VYQSRPVLLYSVVTFYRQTFFDIIRNVIIK
jgi:hypothetical protein